MRNRGPGHYVFRITTPWPDLSPNGKRQRVFRRLRIKKAVERLATATPFFIEAVRKAGETLRAFQVIRVK